MTKSLKAALLSTFIYPGSGQLYLKRYPMAIVFMSIATIAGYFIISSITKQAFQIVERIQSGEISPDITTIMSLVTEQANTGDSQLSNATIIIVLVWVVSIVHAYLIGRVQEKQTNS